VSRFRFVEAEAAQFPVSLLCRVVGVTRQGFYAWRRRPPSARELADRKLGERICEIHAETEEIYGAPRIHSELRLGDGIRVGKKRVARLMRQLGLRGADGKRGGPRTTIRDPKRPSAPDLVDRDFARAEPNRLWVCDLKYIQTGQGFLFLAAVQDVFSRRIVGWSMRDDLRSDLVLDALGIAVGARGGNNAGVIAHSDHGSQYTSLVYGSYAKQSGIDLSMGSIGDSWDNALAESFFASLEKELLRRERFATREQARRPRTRSGAREGT
jgi:putative transposase